MSANGITLIQIFQIFLSLSDKFHVEKRLREEVADRRAKSRAKAGKGASRNDG